jgi:hypothetical protein
MLALVVLQALGWDFRGGVVFGQAYTLATPWTPLGDALHDLVIPALIADLCPCCTTWVWLVGLRFDGIGRNGAFGAVVGTSHSFRVERKGD